MNEINIPQGTHEHSLQSCDASSSEMVTDVGEVGSEALRRIMEEVRVESVNPHMYDRTHNRHNRGK